MRGERGFALVITLMVTALLVALLVEFVNETYVGTSQSHNFVASQQAGVLAVSGAAMGRSLLEVELSNLPGIGHAGYSSLLDNWAQPIQWQDDTGSLTVTITEESGKLNLNSLAYSGADNSYPFRLLARSLFLNLKLPPELCNTAVDWVNRVDLPPQPNGAKSPYYNTLKPPYDVKGAPFDTFEELALVKGFTSDTVAKLKPYLTVYGQFANEPSTKINVNTAPPELLVSIPGVGADVVSRILEYRKTRPIMSLADIPSLGAPSPALLEMITFQGSVFRIHAEGKVGECVSVVEAVVRLMDGSSQILYWREY